MAEKIRDLTEGKRTERSTVIRDVNLVILTERMCIEGVVNTPEI